MVNLLIGKKGTGKTKRLIAKANEAINHSKGYVAVVARGLELRYDINHRARLIDVEEYGVKGVDMLSGFLSGVCAGNYDVTDIFVDTTLKILDSQDAADLEALITKLVPLSEHTGTQITLSISMDTADVPESVKSITVVE